MLFAGKKKYGAAPLILAGFAAMTGLVAYRKLKGYFKVANPDVALREGAELTRKPRRVLAVTAHQDDLEYLAGGSLRLLGLAGGEITTAVATGGDRQRHPDSNASQIRNQEQRDSGVILGFDRVHFLGFSDLSLAHNPGLESELETVWSQTSPDLVLAMDPGFPIPFLVHPDHLAVGRIVLNLARKLKGGAEVLFYGSRQPNVLIDISKVIEDKIQGVLAHKSQLKTWPLAYGLLVRAYGRIAAYNAGISYAESFRSLSLPPLQNEAYLADWSSRAPGRAETGPDL